MKSPTMPGQNSSGEKAAMRVIVAAMTGPAMRLAASAKASSFVHAFAHPPFGELGDDDGVVDQHADRQDQAEQHDHVDRVAHHRQQQDADQERRRDGEADQQRGAAGQRIEDDDEHQDDGDHHVVLQVAEQLVDEDRLVLRVGDLACLPASS